MRVPWFQSLPVRLAWWILGMSGCTLLALTELNRRAVERILGEQAELQAAMAIAAVVDGLDAVAGGTERMTRLVARDLQGRTLTAEEVERIARNTLLDHANLIGFGIAFEPSAFDGSTERFGLYVHRSKTVRRYVTRDLAEPGQAYWNQDWYREAIDKGQLVWGEPFFDRGGSERNVVRVAVPFFRSADDERPAGVVAALVELDWLQRLANVNEFSDTSHVIVFSRSGRLILHPKANYTIAETVETLAEKMNIPELVSIRQGIIAKRQGALTWVEGITGKRVRANYKPARTSGWGVIVAYDEAEFLKGQRSFRGIAAAYLGATLLLFGGIVIGVTRYALRPLGRLSEAADEIARRNLDCDIPAPARADEVGHLARSFGAMRDALKAQHLEREWAAQALEHQLKYNQLIIDSVGELVFVLTKALNISRINPAVTDRTGYAAAEVVRMPLGRLVQLEAAGGSPEPGPDVLAGALKNGTGLRDLPATILPKEGPRMAGRLTLLPILDGNRVVGGVATLRVDAPPAGPVSGPVSTPSL